MPCFHILYIFRTFFSYSCISYSVQLFLYSRTQTTTRVKRATAFIRQNMRMRVPLFHLIAPVILWITLSFTALHASPINWFSLTRNSGGGSPLLSQTDYGGAENQLPLSENDYDAAAIFAAQSYARDAMHRNPRFMPRPIFNAAKRAPAWTSISGPLPSRSRFAAGGQDGSGTDGSSSSGTFMRYGRRR